MNVLLEPIKTERSQNLAKTGKFTFLVLPQATKHQIKEGVTNVFNVDVVAIRTANFSGKTKKSGKFRRVTAGYKKAIVELKNGQTIDLFEVEKKGKKKAIRK